MQSDLLVSSLEDGAQPSGGEWHSLEFSNRLLSERPRPHLPTSAHKHFPQVIALDYVADHTLSMKLRPSNGLSSLKFPSFGQPSWPRRRLTHSALTLCFAMPIWDLWLHISSSSAGGRACSGAGLLRGLVDGMMSGIRRP